MMTSATRRWLRLSTSTIRRRCGNGPWLASHAPIGSLLFATHGIRGVFCFTTTATSDAGATAKTLARDATDSSEEKKIYLHVGPSGDGWIGDAIFAAKHNQPGYVKSIPLTSNDLIRTDDDNDSDNVEGSLLIEILEENPHWAQEIYDTERLPKALKQQLESFAEGDTRS
ncbi:unnamed protein product [Pseudo-nitzschia multistriata]|uniref:Uncharacterized protein n=1 Tax=Pseudo-nitzschia multistriata TaxID=183589 RepID=A0A448ZCK4_9STRA|nr:unnamed protein product [Pseudo-nitzschia multistriata]